jgi:hypothetical protein
MRFQFIGLFLHTAHYYTLRTTVTRKLVPTVVSSLIASAADFHSGLNSFATGCRS